MDAVAGTGARDVFRPEIEGLRGIAILLVVAFHAGLVGLTGGFIGVDVFFVISGFLITGSLVRERTRSGTIGFRDFYARRFRHLLPAATMVVLVTLGASYLLMAPLDRVGGALDAASVGLLVSNVRFAMAESDYFVSLAAPSPFLHFWMLAVEAQFYLVWPLVLVVACLARRPRLGVMLALGAIVIASFLANVVVTYEAANWAFYSFPTRAWQFALGGIIAVGIEGLQRVPRPVLAVAGWGGLIILLVAAGALDGTMPYPGVLALIPTVAALALIGAGMADGGPGRLLATRPLRFLGRISYSLYLWHWPILVLPAIAFEGELPTAVTAALMVAAVGVAWASWRYVEQPFQAGPVLRRSATRTVMAGGLALASVVVISGGLAIGADIAAGPSRGDTAGLESSDPWEETLEPSPGVSPSEPADGGDLTPATEAPSPGSSWPGGPDDRSPLPAPSETPAATATGTPQPTAAPRLSIRLPANVRPPLRSARLDEDRLRGDGCLAFERVTKPRHCVYGNPKGTVTVALVGDSHAAQWFPALNRIAKRHDWRLITYVKVACPFIDMRIRNLILKREYTECAAWRKATLASLRDERPDLTIVSMSRFAIHPVRDADATLAAQGDALAREIERIPGRVAVLMDTPDAGRDVPACLSLHSDDVRKCAIPRATALAGHLGRIERRATRATGDALIDLTERVCRGWPCPVVVDGMIVFRDMRHMTATYAAALAPDLDRAMASILKSGP